MSSKIRGFALGTTPALLGRMAATVDGPESTSIELQTPRGQHGRRFGFAIKSLVVALSALAFVAMLPLAAPLVLAAWTAIVVAPLRQRISGRVGKRKGAAALLTVLLVLAFLVPAAVVALSLSASAADLFGRLQQSKSGTAALQALTSGDSSLNFDVANFQRLAELIKSHAAGALGAARLLFGAATTAVIGLVVFVGGFYEFLVNGAKLYAWLLERSPVSREQSERFAGAFAETGRGLLIGVGLTALLQGGLATIGYVVTGVPQALVLGFLTVFASLIPSVGAALVWVPVTAGLALGGRTQAALVMLGIGLFVSVSDNLVRPLLSRYGKLELPGFVLFVAMLGGIAAFGTWGLLFGPLFVRMAVEALNIYRLERARERPVVL